MNQDNLVKFKKLIAAIDTVFLPTRCFVFNYCPRHVVDRFAEDLVKHHGYFLGNLEKDETPKCGQQYIILAAQTNGVLDIHLTDITRYLNQGCTVTILVSCEAYTYPESKLRQIRAAMYCCFDINFNTNEWILEQFIVTNEKPIQFFRAKGMDFLDYDPKFKPVDARVICTMITLDKMLRDHPNEYIGINVKGNHLNYATFWQQLSMGLCY